jgi:hypothetical protein
MSVGVRGSLLDAALQSISDTVPNGAKSGPHELSQRQRATIKLLNEVFARDIKENIEGYRSIPEGLLKTVTKSPFWELAHGTEIGVAIWNGPSISLNHRRTMIESWALNIPSRLPTSENRYEAKHSPEQNDFKQLKTPQVERREIEDPKRDIALKVAHALAASNPSLGTLGTLGKKDDLVTVMGALIDDSIWNQLRGLSYAKEMWACVSTAEARRVSITEGLRSISRELPAGSESGPTVFNERKRAAIKTVNAVFNQNYPETAE